MFEVRLPSPRVSSLIERNCGCGPPLKCIFFGYSACISLYLACISLYPDIYIYLAILQHIHFYPTVSHCMHYVSLISHYIQLYLLYLLYPAVSHCISPLRKRDITKNTLQGGLDAAYFGGPGVGA